MDILMTIKPHHLWNIRRDKKRWEIRKTKPKTEPYDFPITVYCCESGSGGKVIAEFKCYSIRPLWPCDSKIAAQRACISEDEFMDYMGEKEIIYAWSIDKVIDYTRTAGYKVRHISEFGFNRPPQTWCYIKDGNK